MADFYINGKAFFFDRIHIYLSGHSTELSDYEKSIIEFIADWTSGRKNYELTTSGSTGTPKVVNAERHLLELSAHNTINYLHLSPSYLVLICLNTNFIGGKMMLIRCLMHHMKMYIVEPSLDPFKLYDVSFDFTAIVPLQLEKWLKDPTYKLKINGFRKILIGGAALNPHLLKACKTLDAEVYETYAMTETYSHIAIKNIKSEDHFSIIYPDLIMDTDHRGCLKVMGLITDGKWLQTNDLVDIIEPNKFKLLGRADFVINSGGIKICPEAVEDLIAQHLKIEEKYIVSSIPDAQLGDKLVLVIEGANKGAFNFEFLDKYKRPKELIFLEKFPTTNSGKIDRMKIKKIIFTT